MTETTCPTCGAKCKRVVYLCETCKKIPHKMDMLVSFPQPNLTKLREVFKEYIITATRKDFNFISLCKDIDNLIRAVKEVLDAEASNSANNR